MDIDQLKRQLSDLDSTVLQDFILELYHHYPELADSIEALVLMNDPAALKKALAKRVQSIKRGRKFIDYQASYTYAQQLESIVCDIERGLLGSSPELAFDLVDKFLATAESVLNRVDDSGGAVGEVYQTAVLLWLTAAKLNNDRKIDWVDRVYQLYQANDYGVLDPLLPNSHILLTTDQLTQLVWRYESELRNAMKSRTDTNGLNMEALKSSVALGMLAEALKDPALYERSVLLYTPEPSDLQKKSMVKKYLEFDHFDDALRWLNTPWETRFEIDRLNLLDELYTKRGDVEELKSIRRQLYLRQQRYTDLMHYVEILSDNDKATVRLEAIRTAEKGENILASADLLLKLGETERAVNIIVARHQELAACFYESLSRLAKDFDSANCLLAATACYRALLLDILNQGRSKAYSHAARYYKKLSTLASQISNYAPLADHHAFLDQLERDHGRKRSFWERVNR